jgi:hypothetical protein
MGLTLESGYSKKYAVVKRIEPNSVLRKFKELVPGQVLVGINGEYVVGFEFDYVMWILKQAPRPIVLRFQSFEAYHASNKGLEKEEGYFG